MAKILLATYESTSDAGKIYELNYDDHKKVTVCSCPGSRYYGHCKHTKMFREGKYPKGSVVLTLMGLAKYPALRGVYNLY